MHACLPCIASHRIIPFVGAFLSSSSGFGIHFPFIFLYFSVSDRWARPTCQHNIPLSLPMLPGGQDGWMNVMGSNGPENEWLNSKEWIRRLVPPAGAGMSGMGPLHTTMVSLGTGRSNPPQGPQISMHVPLVYRTVSVEVVD